MRRIARTRTDVGEVVAAVFDAAARYSDDPREVSRLATRTLERMLRALRGPRPRLLASRAYAP